MHGFILSKRLKRDKRWSPARIVSDDQMVEMSGLFQFLYARKHDGKIRRHDDASATVLELVGKFALGIERTEMHDASAGP